jgi:two-component system, NtrC family, response regulator AtoC
MTCPPEPDARYTRQVRAYLLIIADASATLLSLSGRGCLLAEEEDGLRVGAEGAPGALLEWEIGPIGLWVWPALGAAPARVDGRELVGRRELLSGEALAFPGMGCRAVYQGEPQRRPTPRVLPVEAVVRRAREEAERARRYGRRFALLAVHGAPPGEAVSAATVASVRLCDVVGVATDGALLVLFPEAAEQAEVPARRVLAAVGRLAAGARAALAHFPGDGSDSDALVGATREAARQAATGELVILGAHPALVVGGASVVAADPKMRGIFALVRQLAATRLPIVVTGETGVGKEVVAQALHDWSGRTGALVAVNCAAVPETLLESELFGHERGAFSGATGPKQGLFEAAHRGTLLLDEVDECSPRTQAELLRVLESGRLRRVGAVEERAVDVRLVAATNRDLGAAVKAGRFRKDLYYRLRAAAVEIPPLRDRPLDLPLLIRHFLARACADELRAPPRLAPGVADALARHSWPGNLRELRHTLGFMLAVTPGAVVEVSALPPELVAAVPAHARGRGTGPLPRIDTPVKFRPLRDELEELERTRMAQALAASEGVRNRAAALIGMPLRTFVTKAKKHDL